MNMRKEEKISMYMKKLVWYITYIDCFSRIINELIENGDENFKPTDIPNLSELNAKLVSRLRNIIIKMKSDWDFM